ncbi:hypothetical protein A5893_13170 [Pedobacter psychrophilus]|uniref:Uncharacterized protein n=1 Tax=Pedobacter psychrophilus TaxID=1826909 RepID=A0A179DEU3_9SPHI|nr:hypothetical protein [Pedobacter psychrophilus]OAQ38983.1 hypothetical protein A5893_13170 [Pedobacter psychrophilus]
MSERFDKLLSLYLEDNFSHKDYNDLFAFISSNLYDEQLLQKIDESFKNVMFDDQVNYTLKPKNTVSESLF